jgi:hypothetical protein
VSVSVEHSRGLLLAERVSATPKGTLEAALENSRTVVSVDTSVPRAQLTARVLLTTLRRGVGGLVLLRNGLDSAGIDALVAAVSAVDPELPLEVARSARETTVRLHIGPTAADGAIRLLPDGSGAHVAGQRSARLRQSAPATALGAIYTAALGAGEAFKYTARARADRRVLHRHLRFCPVTLSSDMGRGAGSELKGELDFALVGVGAIGTGVALILSESSVSGSMLAVDRQRFAAENRGTYSLGSAADAVAAPWKVDLAVKALPCFEVECFRDSVEMLPGSIDQGVIRWPRLVIGALDSAEARRATQRVWPDRLIDAATGDTFVGLHDHRHGEDPCMYCLFPVRREGKSATLRLAEATGLSIKVLAHGDQPLGEEHLAGLPEEQRAHLLPHLGTPVCGLAAAFGMSDLESAGYRPAIPFVSLQAACLAVGRLAAFRGGLALESNFAQYDALIGPQAANVDLFARMAGCRCETRRASIESARASRRAQAEATVIERADECG